MKENKKTKYLAKTQALIDFCMNCQNKKCDGICEKYQRYEKELRRKQNENILKRR